MSLADIRQVFDGLLAGESREAASVMGDGSDASGGYR